MNGGSLELREDRMVVYQKSISILLLAWSQSNIPNYVLYLIVCKIYKKNNE